VPPGYTFYQGMEIKSYNLTDQLQAANDIPWLARHCEHMGEPCKVSALAGPLTPLMTWLPCCMPRLHCIGRCISYISCAP
jgi:hypothetical protein